MTSALVKTHETWPAADAPQLQVLNDDGAPCLFVREDGSCEITLFERQGVGTFVVPMLFPTITLARQAAQVIGAALEEARELATASKRPDCDHTVVWEGLVSREIRKHRICEDCGAHLGTLVRVRDGWVEELA